MPAGNGRCGIRIFSWDSRSWRIPTPWLSIPRRLLFQILPFQVAFEMHFVLHCILGGIATFYLARNLEFCRSSAFIAAAIYNFSGVTLSFVNLFNILPVVTFLPLLTLTLIKLLQGVTADPVVVGQRCVWHVWLVAGTSVLSGHSTLPGIFPGRLLLFLGESEAAGRRQHWVGLPW